MKIYRTQEVNATGAGIDNGATLYADYTGSNSLGESTTATTSSNSASPELLTHHIATNETQTALGQYRLTLNSYAIRKATHTISSMGTGTPSAISISTTGQAYPNGTAVTARSGTAAVANLDDLYRVLQGYEIANRSQPTATAELTYFDTQGRMRISPNIQLSYGPSDQSTLVQRQSDQPETGQTRYRVKCASTMAASSNGITQLYQDDNALDNAGNVTRQFPERDSNGSSALVSYTGDSNNIYIGAYDNSGTRLAFAQYAGSAVSFLVSAAQASAGNIRFAATRAGYAISTQSLDASAGGTFSVNLTGGSQARLPDGRIAYSSDAVTTGITPEFAVASGNPTLRVDIANVAASASGVYKAVQDGLVSESGNKFAAFGGLAPTYAEDPLAGNAVYLNDADNKFRRKASTDTNASVLASVFPAATAVDSANGDVRIRPGADAAVLAGAVWNAAADSYNTDDTMGKVTRGSGGGGGGATAADIWNYLESSATTSGSLGVRLKGLRNAPTTTQIAQAIWNYLQSAATTTGSMGVKLKGITNFEDQDFSDSQLDDILSEAETAVQDNTPTAAQNADAVWNEATSGHQTAGSAGKRLTDTNTATPLTSAQTASAVLTASNTSTNTGQVGGQIKAAADKTIPTPPSTADIATAVGNSEIIQLIAGVLAGKVSISADGATATFRNLDDDAVVRVITYGANPGERTASTEPDG